MEILKGQNDLSSVKPSVRLTAHKHNDTKGDLFGDRTVEMT